MAGTPSVQQLMQAESEAQSIVEGARQEKSRLLKEARSDAAAEVERFRMEKEAEYERQLSLEMESNQSSGEKLRQDTEHELFQIEGQSRRNQGNVVEMLLGTVVRVEYD
eukprot:CAMPEP_0119120216 /NCGR_PEP_ID=MMETSP1310-20130426/1340_1 /TAXON_ID=464262 /ORGANISM="Genus nov. species nov., Strain RCC2339" /LENGTH=108 /DNA_ID=CAMNT_0007109683 /DNA_START=74 /DNA_END=400 /DNA_ORIENTATION=+